VAEFSYQVDGKVLEDFFASNAFVRALRGPVGSGKSVACCVEVFRRGLEQAPSPVDGLRKTRWAIIRNTQPELKTTTIKTWLDWFPESQYGKFNWSPPFTHYIKRGPLDMEVIFLALDKPEDVKKLLSLELTGAFINEARETPKAIVDGATMRVGRYPSARDGGPTWSGLIMDTNPPDEDHWWPIMAGDVPPPDYFSQEEIAQLVKPKDWEFFAQPGAMKAVKNAEGKIQTYHLNPKRENQKGIDGEYYKKMIAGKTNGWINVYVCNEYGTLTDGKPVYPGFDSQLHVARQDLLPFAGHDIYVGVDFGLSPAAVFAQKVRGRWLILKEIVTQEMGATRFVKLLREEMMKLGGTFSVWGDPAGDQRAQTDENTPFRIFRAAGVQIRPTTTNDIALRIEAVTEPLARLAEKVPGVLIDPSCKHLIKGFEGGYHYRRLQVSGSEKFDDSPNKNRFSHVHDALQYAMLGGGEGRALMQGQNQNRVTVRERNWDVFARKTRTIRKSVLKGW
jgi:hypothetical protein